jgi:hypothetical protein
VSTARGGESSAFEPGLDHLIGALTASGHPHELAGREAARAAFHAASQQPPATGRGRSTSARSTSSRSATTWPASIWSAWRRRPIRLVLPARLAVSAAAIVAVLGGFTAAAAAQALPAPVQQLAYNVLAPLGVLSQPTPSHHSHSASIGHPSPSTAPASAQGALASSPSQTGASATATVGTRPHRKPKAATKPPVVKPVLKLVVILHSDHLIVYGRPGSRVGDLVNLNEWTGTAWTVVASEPLVLGPKGGHKAVFILPVKTAAGQLFQADVLEGAKHTPVASNRLRVPRLPKTGAKAVQPTPSTSLAATGTTAPTPTPTVTSSTTPATSPSPTPTTTPSPVVTGSPTPTPTPTPTADPSPSGTPSASASATSSQSPEPPASDSARHGSTRWRGRAAGPLTDGPGGVWQ